ncbi:hypothetical protein U0C82_13490 [Fulvimarina sp. 2208YS6-2-32]|uniref:Uncharacterized protein n=1 Tax=Fulvimarina uroteuthidis TaxID=3098149 RepID=A0ABU5I5R8_9HYPH|nr:hypothetical protein [Fulvimarina sp. 2208YS6-2-32]MDY8110154.1 hypothetical protein [Fulvimarina sp. 2208YS6-2-32]
MSEHPSADETTADERETRLTLVSPQDVQTAISAGFEIEEVLWMLDLVDEQESPSDHADNAAGSTSTPRG